MILPRPGLGQLVGEDDRRRLAILPILVATWSRISLISILVADVPSPFSVHEGGDGLTGALVGPADDGRLGHRRVVDERRLDFEGRDPVAGDVHDVVDPAEQPDVAVVVALGAVTGEVDPLVLVGLGEPAPVDLLEPVRRPCRACAASAGHGWVSVR